SHRPEPATCGQAPGRLAVRTAAAAARDEHPRGIRGRGRATPVHQACRLGRGGRRYRHPAGARIPTGRAGLTLRLAYEAVSFSAASAATSWEREWTSSLR